MPVFTPTSPAALAVGDSLTATYANANIRDLNSAFGVWNSYTPTITGYTTVTTSVNAAYMRVGKMVLFRGWWNLVTVTTLGSSVINISLPVQAASTIDPFALTAPLGTLTWRSNVGSYMRGAVRVSPSATTASFLLQLPAGASQNLLAMTGAQPTGQVAGDQMWFSIWYEGV